MIEALSSHLLAMERRATTQEEPSNPRMKKKRRNKDTIQRRFTEEQIKLLETMFESETRLEPKKKADVASQLGLQPRQVAIWFQNKRARWKSKRVEQDLKALENEYDNLVSKFESLKNEKHTLISKIQELNDALRKVQGEGSSSKNSDLGGNFANHNILEGLGEKEAFYNGNKNCIEDDLIVNTSHQQVDASLASSSSLENWNKCEFESVVDQSRAEWLSPWF